MPTIEQLGAVTTRSSVLLVIDTGYLNLRSHDRKPVMPDGVLSTEEATNHANSFVDLRIVGADAERVGRMLHTSWHPLYVYDQSPDHEDLQNGLDELVRKTGLDARFEVLSQRIPHRRRVELALEKGTGAGEVQFHGVWAVAVDGVPTSQQIPVLGEGLHHMKTVGNVRSLSVVLRRKLSRPKWWVWWPLTTPAADCRCRCTGRLAARRIPRWDGRLRFLGP